jgi:zinc transporter 1/2/3
MLHSFVIGLTMAVASAQRFAELVPAIFFHQVFEGIALGVRLASLTNPPEDENADSGSAETSDIRSTEPRFVPSRTERILPPLLSFLFAIPIPLILFISLFVPPFPETSSIAPSIFGLNNPTLLEIVGKLHSHSETMQGITSAVSAGLLIYVSCVELLAADFLDNAEMQKNPASVQSGAIVAFAAGAVGMAFI